MQSTFFSIFFSFSFISILLICVHLFRTPVACAEPPVKNNDELVRPCSGAGQWFSSSESKLRKEIESYLDQSNKSKHKGEVVGLICPHAGYPYSGAIAGLAYKQVMNTRYDVVVVVGLSHRYPISMPSVQPYDFYETPLGRVPVDKHSALALLEFSNEFKYVEGAHEVEHSVENQIPFLQVAIPNLKIVPIVINTESLSFIEKIVDDVAKVFKGKKVLFVASTDMSHFPPYEMAQSVDKAALEALKSFDIPSIDSKISQLEHKRDVRGLQCVFCGKGALLTVLTAAKKFGANTVEVLGYQNSGDITGDRSGVVGYGAVALYDTSQQSSGEELAESEKAEMDIKEGTQEVMTLSNIATEPVGLSGEEAILKDEQKDYLLTIAEKTVQAVANGTPAPDFDVQDPVLKQPRGAFVTLKHNGRLKGCIGSFFPEGPLHETVKEMALSAASRDLRFRPVTSKDLPDISVEISVLTPLKLIHDPEEIVVGRDGLLIERGGQSGVLLPQVATEQGWSRTEFLQGTCRKAGLPLDAYEKDAKIYTFSAEIFHRKEH